MSDSSNLLNNNHHGGNNPGGRVGRTGATSTSSSRNASNYSNTQFATLGDLARSSAGLPMGENDSDIGESRGRVVDNPERRPGVGDIFRKAAEAPPLSQAATIGSVESSLVPDVNAQPNKSSDDQEVALRDITFWRDGFSVGDGPLMRYDEPRNVQILNEINAGRAPPHLLNVKVGQPVEVQVYKRTTEYYIASTERSAPGGFPASSTPRVDNTQMKSEVDQTLPTTSVHVRLADGTRLVARLNLHHTVGDIRKFINTSRPGSSSTPYTIQTLFPVRVLDDDSLTIEKADLKNSMVVQKMA